MRQQQQEKQQQQNSVHPDTVILSAPANDSQPLNIPSSIDNFIKEDFITDVFKNNLDTVNDDFVTLLSTSSSSSSLDPTLAQKLHNSLALLPK
eukprot:8058592-Ditylum_brightwellii.AAC.1